MKLKKLHKLNENLIDLHNFSRSLIIPSYKTNNINPSFFQTRDSMQWGKKKFKNSIHEDRQSVKEKETTNKITYTHTHTQPSSR